MMAPPILLLSYEFSGVSGSVDDSAFSEMILSRLVIHFLMKMAATPAVGTASSIPRMPPK